MTSVLVTGSKYKFIPPHESPFWPAVLGRFVPRYLKRTCGISEIEIRSEEKLSSLLQAGHGIVLAPNHCRMSDAIVLQRLARHVRTPFFVMASAHLFHGRRSMSWLLRRLGAFSVYREGIDRQAVQKGIDILTEGKRPLVLFPEGALSNSNEHLNALQEGVSFIARSAAAKLDKASQANNTPDPRRVYTVPIAIRYLYMGDIEASAGAMLTQVEKRLSWRPFEGQCLIERIYRVGHALLSLKEQEYLGQPQSGDIDERLRRLIDHLLIPQEKEFLGGPKDGSVIARVKELRRVLLPEMIEGTLPTSEMDRRWRLLTDASLAQSLSLYPARYVASRPTVDRILETVERFNENLWGDETQHGPMKAIIQVGEPIEVNPKRDRSSKVDALMQAIEHSLNELLKQSADECRMYQPRGADLP
ncbi:MAG: 1-acyl-sn-glycerol-3-phosphate acyltransferase [Planctomycetaceae bacterium]